MDRQSQMIDTRYDALIFAKSAEAARQAAVELVRVVLGEEALKRPLEETIRECCRVLRPAKDARDEARFEDEFVELAIWPRKSEKIAA